MQTVEKNITIHATIAATYAYLRNPKTLPNWMASLVDVTNIQGDGVGQRYEWTYKMSGIPLKGSTTVVEDVPNERVKTKSTGGVDSTFLFTFASDGDTTRLNLRVDYEVPIPVLGALAEKLITKRNERDMETSLQNLKELVEA